jgi:hypothetical protein
MGSPIIFKGKKALLLPKGSNPGDGAILFADGQELVPLSGDPTGSYDAPVGTIGIDSSGKIWVKRAAGAANWGEYFFQDEFISSSAGAGDAGKPIVLDAGGHVDASMVNDADIDHGSIGGLGDDDHTQYHNDTRGDARYYTQTQLDAGQLDNRYFTESEHINSSAGVADAGKPVVLDAAGHIDATMINDGDISHDSLADVSIDDHHARDHAATHSSGGADEVDVKNLGGYPAVATQYLNGTGAFSTPPDTVYTHPNHSGEVTSTGDGAQVLDKTALSNRTDTVITASDTILFGDATDTDNLKKDTVQGILDLVPAGTGEANTGANVGTGTGNVFRDKTGTTLNMKTILAGEGITVTDNANEVQLDVPGDRIPPPLEFNLHSLVTIPLTRFGAGSSINGPRTITGIRIHAFDNGTAGTTRVRIHRSAVGPSGAASTDITLGFASGESTNAVTGASLLTGVAGDVFYAELVSVATGGVTDLSVECFFGAEGLMDSLTIGGRTIVDTSKLVVLYGGGGTTGVSNFCRLYEDGSTTSYVVPGGSNFRVIGYRFSDTNQSRWAVGDFGYADNPPIADQTTTAPTPGIKWLGGVGPKQNWTDPSGSTTTSGSEETAEDFLVPTGKAPFAYITEYATVRVYGILEDI